MSLTRKIAHNTIAQIIGKGLSTILGLVAFAMITRHLGPERYGWYATTVYFLQFVAIIMDFGLIPVTAQMLGSAKDEEKNNLLRNLMGFRIFSSILFLIIAPSIALLLPYPSPVKIAIAIMSLSSFAVSINQVLIGFYQTRLKMHLVSLGEVVGRITLVAGVWALVSQNKGFIEIISIVTLSSVVYMITLWLFARREAILTPAYDKIIWKKIIKTMWPVAIAIIFNVVYLKGDVIILSLTRSQSEVGLYGAAYHVLDIVAQTAMMIMGVILPILAKAWTEGDKNKFRHHLQQAFDAMMALAIPILVGTIILATPIITLISKEAFIESGNSLRILSLAVFGLFLGAIFGHTAVAIGKQKETLWIYISNAILTLIGYLVFIPRFGNLGAAWMTVFSEVYAGGLLMLIILKFSQVKLRLKTFIKILAASAIMALSLHYMPTWHVVYLILTGAIIYSLVLLLMGGISKKTILEIFSLRPKN